MDKIPQSELPRNHNDDRIKFTKLYIIQSILIIIGFCIQKICLLAKNYLIPQKSILVGICGHLGDMCKGMKNLS